MTFPTFSSGKEEQKSWRNLEEDQKWTEVQQRAAQEGR